MNRQRKEKEYNKELKNRLKHHGLLREMLELRQKYKDTPAGFRSQEDYEKAILDWEAEDRRLREKGIYSVKSVRPEKVQHFAGRREELAFIRKNLEDNKSQVLLYGMGGIGKTTIAAAYVERYGGEYENVLFLYYDGSIRSLITDDNRVQINELIYQPEKHVSRLRYYRKKLEALRQLMRMQRTLVILDNCNLSEQKMDKEILTFLNLPAHILVTGRKKEETLFAVSLEIRPFQKKEDLEQLVRSYIPGKLTEEKERELWLFAAKIEYLTLPLVMKMRCFDLETEQKAELLEFKKGLLTAFRLKKSELLVLMYLAIMPAEGMPLELYLEWSGAEIRMLERLENYLLISRQKVGDQEMVRMHPLIAESVLEAMPPTAVNCKTILQNSWRHILGYDSFDGETVWTRSYRKNQQEGPYIFALLQALSGPVPWMAKAYDGLITWLWLMRYDKEAEEQSLQLYQSVRKNYGPVHQITGQIMIRTASVYWNTGRREESFPWYEEGYRVLKESRPYNKSYFHEVAVAAHKLATNVWMLKEEYGRALGLLDESLSLWREQGCPDTLEWRDVIWTHAMRSRSHCLLELGRIEEAEEQWKELERRVPDRFRFSNNWRVFQDFRARSLERQGRKAEAIAITEEMLDGLELCTINEHVELIEAREKAGDRFMKYGYAEKAQEQYEIVSKILRGGVSGRSGYDGPGQI